MEIHKICKFDEDPKMYLNYRYLKQSTNLFHISYSWFSDSVTPSRWILSFWNFVEMETNFFLFLVRLTPFQFFLKQSELKFLIHLDI
jgi:hypothetical protein